MSLDSAIDVASSDNRGGHNRAFSPTDESLLVSLVRAAVPSMTQPQIAIAAIQLRQSIEVGHPQTRARTASQYHHPGFVASSRFVIRLKRVVRLSSHRTAVVHCPRPSPTVDRELIRLQYIADVRRAITQYGPARVLNMDEVSVSAIDAPVTGVVPTGCNAPAFITTHRDAKLSITTFPTITASGLHLPLCAIIPGKTDRTFSKITTRASAAVQRVVLFHSPSGWINQFIMLE